LGPNHDFAFGFLCLALSSGSARSGGRKEETAIEVVAETRKTFGAIDVLANIAGIRAYEPLAEARGDTWEKIIAVNLMSYAYLIREAMLLMNLPS
jgi:NAD(P)-dependent dehydrogenase (short-subunit alcohol dehydrogenase family)